METKTTLRRLVTVVGLLITVMDIIKAQNNIPEQELIWSKDSITNNIYIDSTIENVGIGTIFPEEKLHVMGNVKVKGKIMADSMHIYGAVHFGDSSLVLGTINPFSGTDLIQSTNGTIGIGNGNMANFSNINVGIGVTNPTSRLHLNYNGTGTLRFGNGNRAIEGGNSAGNLHIDATNLLALNHYSTGHVIMAIK